MSGKNTKHVVIVGGGAAGASLAKLLEKKHSNTFKVTLITAEPNWQPKPAIPRLLATAKPVQTPHTNYLKKTEVIVSKAIAVSSTTVICENGKVISGFDFLFLCTGSRYDTSLLTAAQASSSANALVVDGSDYAKAEQTKASLIAATNVVVVGAGSAGLEIAGELKEAYPKKNVTIITSSQTILPRTANAHKTLMPYLTKKLKVQVELGEKVTAVQGNEVLTQSGKKFAADLVYVATGFKPITEFLQAPTATATASTTSASSSTTIPQGFNYDIPLDSQGYVKIDLDMRVQGFKNVFAVGDIPNIAEEKSAYRTKLHIQVAVSNLLVLSKNLNATSLKQYKSDPTVMMMLSLGKQKAVLCKGDSVTDIFVFKMLKNMVINLQAKGPM